MRFKTWKKNGQREDAAGNNGDNDDGQAAQEQCDVASAPKKQTWLRLAPLMVSNTALNKSNKHTVGLTLPMPSPTIGMATI